MNKLKIGIVGLGRLGKDYAQNIAFKVHNAELVAACSIVPEELSFARDVLGVGNCYDTYEKMLENKALEAIIIVSSTDKHAEHIIKALEAGFHVFSEKPLAINYKDCFEVQKVANQHPDKTVMLGFVRRFDPSYTEAKEKIDQNLVGKPHFVYSQTADKDVFAPFQIDFCTSGGGIFNDMSIHDTDLVQWYLDTKVKKVWALGGAYRFPEFGEKGDADNTFVMCEMENGTTAVIGSSRTASFGHNTFTNIMATEGELKIGDPPQKNRLQISDVHGVRYECTETFFDRFKDAFLIQTQEFVDTVLEKKKPILTIENAMSVTLVANAMGISFKEKRVVTLKELMN